MAIELLSHHVKPRHPALEYGVFDGWKDAGLEPTMKAVEKRVIPRLKEVIFEDGRYVYPFLRSNPKEKHEFIKRWQECYQAYLVKDFVEIPEYNLKTGKRNKDWLCAACPTWKSFCRNQKLTQEQLTIYRFLSSD